MMRTRLFPLVLAVAGVACDAGGRTTVPTAPGSPLQANLSSKDGPPLQLPSGARPLRLVNERYLPLEESFVTCDGEVAFGEVSWHEVIVEIQTPDGTIRQMGVYNMVNGGRATSSDGTEYIVHQVNTGYFFDLADEPANDFRSRMMIMAISPGDEPNGIHFFWRSNDGTWSECRG